MPTPTRRFALAIGALAALLILNGAGTGTAVAEPDDHGNPPDPGQSSGPSPPSEPRTLLSGARATRQIHTLVAEALTPYSPFPPKPPAPTLRIMEGGPAGGASGGFVGGAELMPPMPVLRAPMALRSARIAELAVVAAPGIAGLLALTASGGLLGYRQANSGRLLRGDAARFLR